MRYPERKDHLKVDFIERLGAQGVRERERVGGLGVGGAILIECIKFAHVNMNRIRE